MDITRISQRSACKRPSHKSCGVGVQRQCSRVPESGKITFRNREISAPPACQEGRRGTPARLFNMPVSGNKSRTKTKKGILRDELHLPITRNTNLDFAGATGNVLFRLRDHWAATGLRRTSRHNGALICFCRGVHSICRGRDSDHRPAGAVFEARCYRSGCQKTGLRKHRCRTRCVAGRLFGF